MDDLIVLCHFNEVLAFLVRKLEPFFHLRYKAIPEHKQLTSLGQVKQKDLDSLHFCVVCLFSALLFGSSLLLRNLEDWLLYRDVLRSQTIVAVQYQLSFRELVVLVLRAAWVSVTVVPTR